jgi:hypothetical protein
VYGVTPARANTVLAFSSCDVPGGSHSPRRQHGGNTNTIRRTVAALTVVVVAASALGCGDASRAPTGLDLLPLSDVSGTSATTVKSNVQIPTTLIVFVPCANGGVGELIQVQGDLHVLFQTTISSSGNLHSKFHFQPMGISGQGLTTGDKYQGTGVTQGEFSSEGPFPLTGTSVNNFRMIGQGPSNNFFVHENTHITFNANGQVTVVVDNFETGCK